MEVCVWVLVCVFIVWKCVVIVICTTDRSLSCIFTPLVLLVTDEHLAQMNSSQFVSVLWPEHHNYTVYYSEKEREMALILLSYKVLCLRSIETVFYFCEQSQLMVRVDCLITVSRHSLIFMIFSIIASSDQVYFLKLEEDNLDQKLNSISICGWSTCFNWVFLSSLCYITFSIFCHSSLQYFINSVFFSAAVHQLNSREWCRPMYTKKILLKCDVPSLMWPLLYKWWFLLC